MIDTDKILEQKKRRMAQLLKLQYLTIKQAEELDKLVYETGVKVNFRVFHFGLMEFSPSFACRADLMRWVMETDEKLAGEANSKRPEYEDKSLPKHWKKPRPKKVKRQVDALEGKREEKEEYGLFSLLTE